MNEMPQSLWEQCLAIFKNNVNERQYETWLKPIKFKSYDAQAKELKVNVPSQYFYEFLEEHFRRLLLFVIYKIFGEGTQLIYEVEEPITFHLSHDARVEKCTDFIEKVNNM